MRTFTSYCYCLSELAESEKAHEEFIATLTGIVRAACGEDLLKQKEFYARAWPRISAINSYWLRREYEVCYFVYHLIYGYPSHLPLRHCLCISSAIALYFYIFSRRHSPGLAFLHEVQKSK